MNVDEILTELKTERDRLDRAIAALSGTAGRRGRPASSRATALRGKRRGRKRRLTAAGRKRLSQMMKRRWAARKKQGRTRL